MKDKYDVIIVGAGPAGIFTAFELSELNRELDILILDKGQSLEKRNCSLRDDKKCKSCSPCHITSGWSGAGGFSDGKLSKSPKVGGRLDEYLPKRKVQELIDYTEQIYINFGAPDRVYGLNDPRVDELNYEASKHAIKLISSPIRHLGTEMVYLVFKNMHDYLLNNNTNLDFCPLTTAERIIVKDGEADGVKVSEKHNKKNKIINAEKIVAAPGRSGARWLAKQCDRLNIPRQNNEVDIGVRVEVPNSIIDHLTDVLYEAKLIYYSDTFENKVRSFCMNPGGLVAEEHYDGEVALVNGHSYSDSERKSDNTNFALLVSTRFTKPFNQPLEYGKYIARLANMLTGGGIMVQRLGDLLMGRRTDYSRLEKSTTVPTMISAVPGDLSYVLPQRYLQSIIETLKVFDNLCPGLYARNTLLYGVEVKFYSSKVDLDDRFLTPVDSFYAIGDGAGITRGLMQASVSGVVVARDIVRNLS